jgi:sporulation protein YlmC with PRC-barrel domain
MMRAYVSTTIAGVALICGIALAQDAPVVKKQVQVKPGAVVESTAASQESGRIIRATQLIGLQILNENGESLGNVEDFVIDNRNAQVQYVILKTADDTDKYHTLPYKTLSLYQGEDPKDVYFIAPVPRERLVKGPTIVREQWPTMTYTQWQTFVPQVNRYYETVKPIPPRAIRRANR